MPVNMDPSKKRRKTPEAKEPPKAADATPHGSAKPARLPDEATERDREHALADAEWKNLWDATEVIDMDRW